MTLTRGKRVLGACFVLSAGLAGGPRSPAATGDTAEPAATPASLALLQSAQRLANDGRSEEAAAILERAIRMETRNPWLWHRLAVLRFQEGRHSLAIELAKKSNVLARDNRRLVAGNWLLIGKARAGLGDAEGAAAARARARGYLRHGGS